MTTYQNFSWIVRFAARGDLDNPVLSFLVRGSDKAQAETMAWRKAWRRHPEWNRGTHRLTSVVKAGGGA